MYGFTISAGRTEYGGGNGRVALRLRDRLASDSQRQLDCRNRAPALCGWQPFAGGQHRRRRHIARAAREYSAACLPAVQAGTAHADSFDEHAHHPARPRITLQLLPPKPNELLITRSTRADWFSTR